MRFVNQRRLSNRLSSTRRAFTLVELLVVITIIGFLMAMVFPAISGVLELMNSLSCRGNLTNLAKGVKTYSGKWKQRLPPGVVSCNPRKDGRKPIFNFSADKDSCQGPTWSLAIVAAVDTDMGKQYEAGMIAKGKNACINATRDLADPNKGWGEIGSKTPQKLLCPSAEESFELLDAGSAWEYGNLSKGNYAANFGSDTLEIAHGGVSKLADQKKQGPFRVEFRPRNKGTRKGTNLGMKLASISDGEEKTIMFSEVISYDSSDDGRGVWSAPLMGGSMFTAKTTPNYFRPPSSSDEGANNDIDTIPVCNKSIASSDPLKCVENRRDAKVWAAARSSHPGEINVVFVDGTPRAIPDTIELRVWQALCTAKGSEPGSSYPDE